MVSTLIGAGPIEKKYSIIVELRVQKIAQSPNKEFCIYTQGIDGNENLRINFRILKDNIERLFQGKGRYKFEVILDSATEETKRVLSEALSRKFGGAEPRTIFKPRGYIAECLKLPEQFVKTGGNILLIDPGLDEGGGWAINIMYSPNDNAFVLEISELRA